MGPEVTPNALAVLPAAQVAALAAWFGSYFETQPPSVGQVE
jgi:hypothetical protein